LTVLGDTYSEGNLVDIRSDFPASEDPFTEKYEYWSDSDLEEEEEEEDDDDSKSDCADEAEVSPSGEGLPKASLSVRSVYDSEIPNPGRDLSEKDAYPGHDGHQIVDSFLHSDHASNECVTICHRLLRIDFQ
jgi:hypothetical protein